MKILIILAVIGFESALGQSLSCNFTGSGTSYTCNLRLTNPNGNDNFTTIDGEHLAGRTDDDVRVISGSGSSTNMPSIICNKFRGLTRITIRSVGMLLLGENSFAGCPNLTSIDFYNNRIAHLHRDVFLNNPTMDSIIIYNNQIRFNESGVFDNIPRLTYLCIDANPLGDLPLDIFRPLSNLRTLHLYTNQLNRLRPEWFESFSSLTLLQMWNNGIPEIPKGTFKNLRSIQTFQIYNNVIRTLPSDAFTCMRNLTNFQIHNNQIEAVDSRFFELAPNLSSLNFGNNRCINQQFTNFHLNRTGNLLAFQQCFNAFNGTELEEGTCKFIDHDVYGYTCEIVDAEYKEGEFPIITNHAGCFTDFDVTGVVFTSSKVDKIPSQIFSTFPNLQFVQAADVGLETTLIDDCGENLKFIDVSHNSIKKLPSNSFAECQNLEEIIIDNNCISSVEPCGGGFIENFRNLKNLSMKSTTCADAAFDLILQDRKEVMEVLRNCYAMWYMLTEF